MKRKGPKPKSVVKIRWSGRFAYAIGLIATDGCVYQDGRHINLTSKDLEMVENFQKALSVRGTIGRKGRGNDSKKLYYVVQVGDALFCRFLWDIGIMPAKSKTIGKISIPEKYFFDFLRGCFDGDGCSYSYWDKRWKSSFLFYTCFASASQTFILWIREEIFTRLSVKGHITKSENQPCYQLKYGKQESLLLLRKMYPSSQIMSLSRKRLKINESLAMIGQSKL